MFVVLCGVSQPLSPYITTSSVPCRATVTKWREGLKYLIFRDNEAERGAQSVSKSGAAHGEKSTKKRRKRKKRNETFGRMKIIVYLCIRKPPGRICRRMRLWRNW